MLRLSKQIRSQQHQNLTKFLSPAVYSNFDTDFQLLKHDLKRLFPEKFLPENRQYINICQHGRLVDCYLNFASYRENNLFPNSRPANLSFELKSASSNVVSNLEGADLGSVFDSLDASKVVGNLNASAKQQAQAHNQDINFMNFEFCEQFLRFFVKKNYKFFEAENILLSEIELVSLDADNAILELKENLQLKIQKNFPLLSLETPEFHPLLNYNIKCPILFKANLNSSQYQTVVMHSENLKQNDFKIVETEVFYQDPSSLDKNVAVIVLDQKFPESSPIYLSQILHNRIQKDRTKLIEPFYKSRFWKKFADGGTSANLGAGNSENSSNTATLRLVSYNMLANNLAQLGASQSKKDEYQNFVVNASSDDEIDISLAQPKEYETNKRVIEHTSGWPHLHETPELEFMYRKQLLHHEIQTYNPDIICFQEGEKRAIPLNFEIVEGFNSKSGQATLLTCFNPERFRLEEFTTTTYHSIASSKEASLLASTNHRFLVCYFTDLESNLPFIVTNTHLYWKDLNIRGLQFNLLLAGVLEFGV